MLQGESRRSETLSALFKLNDAIGRRSRSSREERLGLLHFQQYVNAITVAVKNSDSKLMEESVVHAEEILRNLTGGQVRSFKS